MNPPNKSKLNLNVLEQLIDVVDKYSDKEVLMKREVLNTLRQGLLKKEEDNTLGPPSSKRPRSGATKPGKPRENPPPKRIKLNPWSKPGTPETSHNKGSDRGGFEDFKDMSEKITSLLEGVMFGQVNHKGVVNHSVMMQTADKIADLIKVKNRFQWMMTNSEGKNIDDDYITNAVDPDYDFYADDPSMMEEEVKVLGTTSDKIQEELRIYYDNMHHMTRYIDLDRLLMEAKEDQSRENILRVLKQAKLGSIKEMIVERDLKLKIMEKAMGELYDKSMLWHKIDFITEAGVKTTISDLLAKHELRATVFYKWLELLDLCFQHGFITDPKDIAYWTPRHAELKTKSQRLVDAPFNVHEVFAPFMWEGKFVYMSESKVKHLKTKHSDMEDMAFIHFCLNMELEGVKTAVYILNLDNPPVTDVVTEEDDAQMIGGRVKTKIENVVGVKHEPESSETDSVIPDIHDVKPVILPYRRGAEELDLNVKLTDLPGEYSDLTSEDTELSIQEPHTTVNGDLVDLFRPQHHGYTDSASFSHIFSEATGQILEQTTRKVLDEYIRTNGLTNVTSVDDLTNEQRQEVREITDAEIKKMGDKVSIDGFIDLLDDVSTHGEELDFTNLIQDPKGDNGQGGGGKERDDNVLLQNAAQEQMTTFQAIKAYVTNNPKKTAFLSMIAVGTVVATLYGLYTNSDNAENISVEAGGDGMSLDAMRDGLQTIYNGEEGEGKSIFHTTASKMVGTLPKRTNFQQILTGDNLIRNNNDGGSILKPFAKFNGILKAGVTTKDDVENAKTIYMFNTQALYRKAYLAFVPNYEVTNDTDITWGMTKVFNKVTDDTKSLVPSIDNLTEIRTHLDGVIKGLTNRPIPAPRDTARLSKLKDLSRKLTQVLDVDFRHLNPSESIKENLTLRSMTDIANKYLGEMAPHGIIDHSAIDFSKNDLDAVLRGQEDTRLGRMVDGVYMAANALIYAPKISDIDDMYSKNKAALNEDTNGHFGISTGLLKESSRKGVLGKQANDKNKVTEYCLKSCVGKVTKSLTLSNVFKFTTDQHIVQSSKAVVNALVTYFGWGAAKLLSFQQICGELLTRVATLIVREIVAFLFIQYNKPTTTVRKFTDKIKSLFNYGVDERTEEGIDHDTTATRGEKSMAKDSAKMTRVAVNKTNIPGNLYRDVAQNYFNSKNLDAYEAGFVSTCFKWLRDEEGDQGLTEDQRWWLRTITASSHLLNGSLALYGKAYLLWQLFNTLVCAFVAMVIIWYITKTALRLVSKVREQLMENTASILSKFAFGLGLAMAVYFLVESKYPGMVGNANTLMNFAAMPIAAINTSLNYLSGRDEEIDISQSLIPFQKEVFNIFSGATAETIGQVGGFTTSMSGLMQTDAKGVMSLRRPGWFNYQYVMGSFVGAGTITLGMNWFSNGPMDIMSKSDGFLKETLLKAYQGDMQIDYAKINAITPKEGKGVILTRLKEDWKERRLSSEDIAQYMTEPSFSKYTMGLRILSLISKMETYLPVIYLFPSLAGLFTDADPTSNHFYLGGLKSLIYQKFGLDAGQKEVSGGFRPEVARDILLGKGSPLDGARDGISSGPVVFFSILLGGLFAASTIGAREKRILKPITINDGDGDGSNDITLLNGKTMDVAWSNIQASCALDSLSMAFWALMTHQDLFLPTSPDVLSLYEEHLKTDMGYASSYWEVWKKYLTVFAYKGHDDNLRDSFRKHMVEKFAVNDDKAHGGGSSLNTWFTPFSNWNDGGESKPSINPISYSHVVNESISYAMSGINRFNNGSPFNILTYTMVVNEVSGPYHKVKKDEHYHWRNYIELNSDFLAESDVKSKSSREQLTQWLSEMRTYVAIPNEEESMKFNFKSIHIGAFLTLYYSIPIDDKGNPLPSDMDQILDTEMTIKNWDYNHYKNGFYSLPTNQEDALVDSTYKLIAVIYRTYQAGSTDGAHFVCTFNHKGVWYFYDDTKPGSGGGARISKLSTEEGHKPNALKSRKSGNVHLEMACYASM